MSPDQTEPIEDTFLATCRYDNTVIDQAVQRGLTEAHFADACSREQWRLTLTMRLSGQEVSDAGLYAEAVKRGLLEKLGGVERIIRGQPGGTLGSATLVDALIETHGKRESWKRLHKAVDLLERNAAGLGDVKQLADEVSAICAGKQSVQRSTAAIATEAIAEAEEQIAGTRPARTLITTGLPTFDRIAMPIESHEYVVVGARTSHGKSSFLLQVAGHNLAQKKRVVIFTLETSDKAVVKQIAGQRANVNLRKLEDEPREKQQEYLAKLRYAQTADNLLVFDRDLTIEQIEARCRLLKASYQPELVIIDYLGIIGVGGDSSMERMNRVSAAMIPLTKMLGCAVMVGCQLNRSSEKEERAPTRTDFRDSGSIEQDGHRLICIWRKPNQYLDSISYDCQLLQLKLRDGPTACIDMKFHSPTTRFYEEAR